MEVKKCKKCGAFYTSGGDCCYSCNIKLEKVYDTINTFIANEGINIEDYSKEDLIGKLSVNLGEINKRDLCFGIDNLME